MAEETERVEYVFEGDISSLRSATQTAIDLLNRYSDSMRRASDTDAFTASQRSTKSMNASINRLTRDLSKMQSKLKGVGDVKLPTGSVASKAMESALNTINEQMHQLDSTGSITTKTLTGLKTQLEGVRATVQAASPQVDKLVASEQRFQNILGTVQGKADQFRASMDSLRTRMSGTFDPITSKLSTFSASFSNITSRMQSFRDTASTAFSRVSQLASACASAFRRVSQDADAADDAADSAAGSHRNLGDIFGDVTSAAQRESDALNAEKSQLDSKESSIKKSVASHNKLLQSLTNLGNRLRTENTTLNKFTDSLKNLGSTSSVVRKALTVLTGVQLGDWLAQATNNAISFIENLNLFSVAMGDSLDRGLEFVDTMQEIYGMDPSNLYRYAGYFYQLTDAIGMTDSASATLSLSLTRAANDIASLFNVDIETVVDNLSAGMQGMSRAVRKYGMDIRATTLQQTAYKYGLTEQVETMSEANRMALRYITMMEQVSNATQQMTTGVDGASTVMGDFARNIETPANQLRIFKEQMSQLGRAIGNFIIVPLQRVISYVNGFVMALRTAINFIAGLLGVVSDSATNIDVSGATNAADAVEGIGSAASAAADELDNLTAPFDELNILQEQTSSGGGGAGTGFGDTLDPALEEAIANMDLGLDNIRMKANEIRDALLEFFGFTVEGGDILSWDSSQFESNLIDKFPQWTQTIQAAFDNWSEIVDGFKSVFDSIIGVVDNAISKITSFFSLFINDDSVSTFIENLGGNLQSLAGWISENEELLANLAVVISAVASALGALKILSPILTTFANFGSAIGSILAPLASVLGPIGLISGILALLYTNSSTFATSFNSLFTTVGAGLGIIGTSLIETLTTIGTSIATLWDTSIQPTLNSLGEALAPVLETLGSLWTNVSNIISDAFTLIQNAWTNTLAPVLDAVMSGVQSLATIFENLWTTVIGPIVENIGTGISTLWKNTLSPIIEKVISIVGNLVEALMGLWNNVLAPLVNYIVDTLGPSISNIFNSIWDTLETVVTSIGTAIDGLLTIFDGFTDFLAGIFTGDWNRVWKGIKNIFIGFGNGLIGTFETALNGVIFLLNSAIAFIYNGVVGLINSVLGVVEDIAAFIGFDLDLTIDSPPPQIPDVSFPRIPEAATGGIVTSPTYLLAGEGRYDEAIIPLGDSPQMADMVQQIADAVNNPSRIDSNNTPIEVRVFIGGNEWDAFTYESSQRGSRLVGAQPIKEGRA